jgi:hypothetical protein
MRGRFGLFGVLLIVVLALLVGGVAYNWGLAAGQTQVVAPGTVGYPVVYGHPYGFGFGFGLFGLLFFFLIFGLLISAFRGRRWGGGPGGWGKGMGPGGWGPGWGGRYDPTDPAARQWQNHDVPPSFEAWHRRAHGEPGPDAPSGGTGSSGGSSSPGAGGGSGASGGTPTSR